MKTKEEILNYETGLTINKDMVLIQTEIQNVFNAMEKYHKSKQKEINEDADRIVKKEIQKRIDREQLLENALLDEKKEIDRLRDREGALEKVVAAFLTSYDDGMFFINDTDKGFMKSVGYNCVKDLRDII